MADDRVREKQSEDKNEQRNIDFLKEILKTSPEQHLINTTKRVVFEVLGKGDQKGKGKAMVNYAAIAKEMMDPNYGLKSEEEQFDMVKEHDVFIEPVRGKGKGQ